MPNSASVDSIQVTLPGPSPTNEWPPVERPNGSAFSENAYCSLSRKYRSASPYGGNLPDGKAQEWEQERTLKMLCKLSGILVGKGLVSEIEMNLILKEVSEDAAGPARLISSTRCH